MIAHFLGVVWPSGVFCWSAYRRIQLGAFCFSGSRLLFGIGMLGSTLVSFYRPQLVAIQYRMLSASRVVSPCNLVDVVTDLGFIYYSCDLQGCILLFREAELFWDDGVFFVKLLCDPFMYYNCQHFSHYW